MARRECHQSVHSRISVFPKRKCKYYDPTGLHVIRRHVPTSTFKSATECRPFKRVRQCSHFLPRHCIVKACVYIYVCNPTLLSRVTKTLGIHIFTKYECVKCTHTHTHYTGLYMPCSLHMHTNTDVIVISTMESWASWFLP
uniref:Uncharacterized protein n=1 Tax=Rhipicephalus zambeziensis TaxID=60191 RepID=A0A224YJN9_9ACAR